MLHGEDEGPEQERLRGNSGKPNAAISNANTLAPVHEGLRSTTNKPKCIKSSSKMDELGQDKPEAGRIKPR